MTEQVRKLQKFIPPGVNAVVRVAFHRFDGDTLTGRMRPSVRVVDDLIRPKQDLAEDWSVAGQVGSLSHVPPTG